MSAAQQLRRVGVIGDVHAEDYLLFLALTFLYAADIDLIMAVGDIADGPGNVDRCCDLLQKFKVAAVAGNHDRWFLADQARDLPDATASDQVNLEARLYLRGLPQTRSFDTIAGRLLLCHGLGENDMAGVWPGDYGYALEQNLALLRLVLEQAYRFVVNGHTHHRLVRCFDRLTIINAGTLSRKQQPCFMVVDFEQGKVQYYDLDQDGQISESELLGMAA